MIKALSIKNFQSHKDTRLEFVAPGVNVIVGKSRSGKTSLLRAIRKVLENRPIAGMERWIHGQDPKETISIVLETTDGHIVTWNGPNPQKYVVDGEELIGFGQSVPPLVSKILNLGEINIQSQHDQPYLLFDSPGEVARVFNRVVNLKAIDLAIANVAAMGRQNSQDIRGHESRLLNLKEAEAGFPDLMAVDEFIASLEGIESEVKDKQAKISLLESIQAGLARLGQLLAQWKIPDGLEFRIGALIHKQTELAQKRHTLNVLTRIQHDLSRLQEQATTTQSVLGKEADISRLLAKQAQLQARRRTLVHIQNLNENIRKREHSLSEKLAIIGKTETELRALMPPECPLCGQEIGK